MAGTVAGGKKAAEANKAKDPDFYAKIGAMGGRNGTTGGFAYPTPCSCSEYPREHLLANCAGARGGKISKRTKVMA